MHDPLLSLRSTPSKTPVSTKSKGKVGSLLKRSEIKCRLEGGGQNSRFKTADSTGCSPHLSKRK